MFQNSKVRWSIIVLVIGLSVYWVLPNFMFAKDNKFLPESKIVKGLDIQGGIHLVLGVDIKTYMRDKIERFSRGLKEDFSGEGITYESVTPVEDPKPSIVIKTKTASDINKIVDFMNTNFPGTFQALESSDSHIQWAYYENVERQINKQVVNQAIEVIRNRIDSYGTLEPNIAAQGEDRILVQLPGIEDSQKAKELINTTAKLEFMIVDSSKSSGDLQAMVGEVEKKGNYTLGQTEKNGLEYSTYVRKVNQDLKSRLPENTEIIFQKPDAVESLTQSRTPFLVKNDQVVTGNLVEDAYVSRDSQSGRPEVAFKMSVDGRKPFGDLTGSNVDKQMAIVLDKVLKTAPVLQSKITDAGRITLGSSNYQEIFEEAEFISRTLRAGALPASLEQLEERTVGPTLGADSIRKGKYAGIAGGTLVILFMIIFYGLLGVVASVALGLNILLILGVLSTLGATLTLPGIAGIVLTVGIAVDANVIIFERIKEELRKGTGLKAAIRDGFGNALSAILDANITTAIVCIMLMQFGTGPIRGFAVTLICGVITSMFTAIFFSRSVVDVLVLKLKLQKIVRY